VKKGQVLATLDPTLTTADVNAMQQKMDSDIASIDRLTAEQSDVIYTPAANNAYTDLQLSIWHQRHAEYQANVAGFDAQIRSAEAIIRQYQHDSDQYRKRLEIATDSEKRMRPLAEKGYVAPLQLNNVQDAKEEATRLYGSAQQQIAAQQQVAANARAQRSAFIEKWHGDVGAQLVAARNDLDLTRENLAKAQKLLELGTLVSPADAIVLKIGQISTGSIASTGGSTGPDAQTPQLFTLAPLDAPLEALLDVPSQNIGFIRPGDTTRIKLDAYSFIRHGTVGGEIKSISEGSFTTNDNGAATEPYFKVRVAITDVNLRNVPPDFRLIPGMTVTGDVMVGRRTILSYLLEGALRTGSEAMREAQ